VDFITPLIGFLFFIGICVAMYRVGCIRADVREIKDLLKRQAGEPEQPEKPKKREWWD